MADNTERRLLDSNFSPPRPQFYTPIWQRLFIGLLVLLVLSSFIIIAIQAKTINDQKIIVTTLESRIATLEAINLTPTSP
jgi:hypothetical protein